MTRKAPQAEKVQIHPISPSTVASIPTVLLKLSPTVPVRTPKNPLYLGLIQNPLKNLNSVS
jgi:hypothetical protein